MRGGWGTTSACWRWRSSGSRGDSPTRAASPRSSSASRRSGSLFSLWLTYLELFVIHAICQWCVVSAILATILFVLSWLDLREVSALLDEQVSDVAESLREGSFGARIRNTSEVALRAVRGEY